MNLLAMDRRNIILERVQTLSSVRVTELAEEFGVTEETIRRDLEKLEAEGYVTRTYGGAVLVQNNAADLSIYIRETQNPEGKRRIARCVAQMIEDRACLMIDSSTTSMFVARNLKEQKNVTIITNSARLPQELSSYDNLKVIITGGLLRPEIMSLVGVPAENTVERYYADYAIIGCKALDPEAGFTFEPHERESVVKQKMCRNARKVILVADHTKFGQRSLIRTLDFSMIQVLVTDEPLGEETQRMIEEKGIQIIYA